MIGDAKGIPLSNGAIYHAYSIGVGFGSKVYAESNAFADLVAAYNAAYNAANGTAVGSGAGRTPALFTRVHPPRALRALVPAGAGAGRLR
ncbi:hypothetical protein [Nonomuraea sp. B19D2]|uniref:hypothetical protein n=1 Tax=Nonomuraea sp. B19D2 TaxID=3159561 RepID=UPI0032DB96F7